MNRFLLWLYDVILLISGNNFFWNRLHRSFEVFELFKYFTPIGLTPFNGKLNVNDHVGFSHSSQALICGMQLYTAHIHVLSQLFVASNSVTKQHFRQLDSLDTTRCIAQHQRPDERLNVKAPN